METEDPRAALGAADIPTRAAGARDLARTGTVADVDALLERVRADKSPSVRLYAAAGVAEILMRHRGAYDQQALEPAERDRLLAAVGAFDPAAAPGLLLAYAAFPEPSVVSRLVRLLRAPRHEVRVGAAAALRRMALSSAATREGPGVREWAAEALKHPKTGADARIELVRLVGQAGWMPLRKLVLSQPDAGEVMREAVDQAIERLDARASASAWTGVWVDEGLDVLQLGEPADGAWLVLSDVAGGAEDGLATVDGRPARRVWAPRLKHEGEAEAIQQDGRTYWRLAGERVVATVEALDAGLTAHADAAPWLLEQLAEQKGAAARRAEVILCVRCGRADQALTLLEPLMAGKKVRNDLHFLHGLALRASGRLADGDAALRTYLEKARASEPWRAEAEALLAGD